MKQVCNEKTQETTVQFPSLYSLMLHPLSYIFFLIRMSKRAETLIQFAKASLQLCLVKNQLVLPCLNIIKAFTSPWAH